MGYISIQNAKIFEMVQYTYIGKRKKKTLFFHYKFLIEENGYKCEPEVWRHDFWQYLANLK